MSNTTTEKKGRGGRKPMTPEQKAAAAEARAAAKAQADNLKPEFIIQYQGTDTDLSVLVENAKADFRQTKKRTLITELKLYVKPEDSMAYYVINGQFEGKISFERTAQRATMLLWPSIFQIPYHIERPSKQSNHRTSSCCFRCRR